MFDLSREALAYSILIGVGVLALPWLGLTLRRHRREKLRRRGIKRFGH